jgi:hypothetical protein
VGNVQIYKEVLSAQFDWLRSRGVLAAETRQGPALSRRATSFYTGRSTLSRVARSVFPFLQHSVFFDL